MCSAVPETLRTSGIHGIFSRVKRNKPPSRRAESGPGAASDRARRAPRASPVARLHRARAARGATHSLGPARARGALLWATDRVRRGRRRESVPGSVRASGARRHPCGARPILVSRSGAPRGAARETREAREAVRRGARPASESVSCSPTSRTRSCAGSSASSVRARSRLTVELKTRRRRPSSPRSGKNASVPDGGSTVNLIKAPSIPGTTRSRRSSPTLAPP